jgi:hypothetical protein
MKVRFLLLISSCALLLSSLLITGSSAKRLAATVNQQKSAGSDGQQPRDEKLWKRALEIQRRAIVIDSHNDITTPMTNDDYDLGGPPPEPYRTSSERMKQGGPPPNFSLGYQTLVRHQWRRRSSHTLT